MGKLGFYMGNHFVAYYGLAIVLGTVAAAAIAYIQTKRYKLSANDFVIACATAILFGVIGAKVLYILVSIESIDFARLTEIEYLASIMQGGFVFYGGLAGGLIGIWLCKRFFQIQISPYIQSCMACLPVAHGFGRIGCFLVGCCYGGAYDGLGAITYRHSFYAPNNMPLFPVQLVEAMGDFCIAALLLLFQKKLKGNTAFFVYIIYYASMRFFLEFARSDEARGLFMGISLAQYISVAAVVLCGIGLSKAIVASKRF